MRSILLVICLWWIYRRYTLKPIETDILVSPGGYKGIYMIGICHYLKTHFEIDQKTVTGLSCGSLLSLFLVLNPERDNDFIRAIFEIEFKKSLPSFLQEITHTLVARFKTEDFDLDRVQIGVTTWRGLECFHKFLTLTEATHGCKASCFVPFVTCRDLMLVYHNKLTLDGGLFYKRAKSLKKKETFLLTSSMFGRYKESMMSGFRKPKCSYYQMYLYGYSDARKNHALFESYFKRRALVHTPLSSAPSPLA